MYTSTTFDDVSTSSPPDLGQNPMPRQHHSRIAEKKLEKSKLERRQVDLSRPEPDLHRFDIHFEAIKPQPLMAVRPNPA